jgi:hypothetical protein
MGPCSCKLFLLIWAIVLTLQFSVLNSGTLYIFTFKITVSSDMILHSLVGGYQLLSSG